MLGMIRGHVDRMELLKKQDALVTEVPDEKVNPAVLVKNIVGTANIPIRATINAPESTVGSAFWIFLAVAWLYAMRTRLKTYIKQSILRPVSVSGESYGMSSVTMPPTNMMFPP